MRTPIEIGEEYRVRCLPKCWEEPDRLLRRHSWKGTVLAWVMVIGLAVAGWTALMLLAAITDGLC